MPKTSLKTLPASTGVAADSIAKEVDALKRLQMLLLTKLGSTSEEIAMVLEIDASAVRRIVPSRRIKRIVGGALSD